MFIREPRMLSDLFSSYHVAIICGESYQQQGLSCFLDHDIYFRSTPATMLILDNDAIHKLLFCLMLCKFCANHIVSIHIHLQMNIALLVIQLASMSSALSSSYHACCHNFLDSQQQQRLS